MKQKKKILIDLDVVTVALWDFKEEALKFIDRVKRGEFEVYAPYVLIELVSEWKHSELRKKIIEFYNLYAIKISTIETVNIAKEIGIDYTSVIKQLEENGVKEEDAILVFTASIFNLDYLVSFNKIHLINKKIQLMKY